MRLHGPASVGLLGRILAILIVALAIEFVASTILYERSSRALIHQDEADRLAEHLVIARKLISEKDWPERPAMAERLTTDRYDIHWAAKTSMPAPLGADRGAAYDRVLDWEPTLADSDLRVRLTAVGRKAQLLGALKLSDGTWMRFRAAIPEGEEQPGWHRILIALLPTLVLLLVGAWLLRQTLRSMARLARAADRIGRSSGLILPEIGPREVRRVIRAFNAMQSRIERLITDRTQALAAVGHDMRTPLARLQLRADGIADPALRREVESDVAEMGSMVGSLLSFLGGEGESEAEVRTDLAVLAATIVDDLADRGEDALYVGNDHLEASIRPTAMKRAIGNLVENALHYGGNARVGVTRDESAIVVSIEDDGPGIPPDQLAIVLEPFSRLDQARSRNTSGFGLGLASVVRIAEAEGGSLRLSNRPEGGLRAELRFPAR